ncbi:IS5 family transposase [Candidatus Peregrinibacteria bacterium]|nr:IS5 family transposase [Candidatus Peregrinibacteria bacterium]
MIKSSDEESISFGDFLLNPKNMQTRKREFFERVNEMINWNPIVYRIEKLYSKDNGRPGFSALMMFKSLLLAQWYGLSDPELEDCLKDRISFKKFVGLQMEDDVPDETTICRFRNKLMEKDLLKKLFKILNAQLEQKGIFVQKGTLIDASIVNAGKGTNKTRDDEATWTKKNDKSYFGYKIHQAMDMGSGLVHSLDMTTAKVHDSEIWDSLLHGKERAIFADKGYYDVGYKRVLRFKDIYCGILDKNTTRRKLSSKQKRRNKRNAGLRAPVERFFAVIKEQYKYIRARYRGLKKNMEHMFMLGIAFNIERSIGLLYSKQKNLA